MSTLPVVPNVQEGVGDCVEKGQLEHEHGPSPASRQDLPSLQKFLSGARSWRDPTDKEHDVLVVDVGEEDLMQEDNTEDEGLIIVFVALLRNDREVGGLDGITYIIAWKLILGCPAFG